MARAGQWDAALAEFLASRELYPTRSATRNAAIALRQLKRNVDALELYERLLSEFGSSVPAQEAAWVRAEIGQLVALAGELELRVNQTGFRATLDGQQQSESRSGAILRVEPGTHTIRVGKDGFETVEQRFSVASGTRKVIQVDLKPLAATGEVVIREETGAVLDVLVDAILVGKTPWRGNLAPGRHSVALGNGRLGTPPSSADVKAGATLSLSLRATQLDAQLRIEPMPANAAVFIDGVSVGNGIWAGRLPKGVHRVEVATPGYLLWQRDIQLSSDRPNLVRATLERDTSNPLFRGSSVPRIYVEAMLGPLMAPSLHGDADEKCACTDRSRPLGAMGTGRVGYAFQSGLGVELNLGYMALTETMTRNVVATGEASARQFQSTDYQDSTTLTGPLAAISASFRGFKATPVTARLGVGIANLSSSTSAKGTFRGQVPDPRDAAGPAFDLTTRAEVSELERNLLTPFVQTELRVGYRLSKRWSLDAGAALLLMLAPRATRAGSNTLSAADGRSIELDGNGARHASGAAVRPGAMTLPNEIIAETFLALTPSLGLRFEL